MKNEIKNGKGVLYMKKWFCLALSFILLFGLIPSALAQQTGVYQLGDQMEDFSATLSDGTQVSLYGLLKEKKAVLINFWASWCGPCKREFPYMEQAYDEMADEIGVIALSCEKMDTDESVLAFKQELGLQTLPLGLDTGLEARFALQGYPTSVMVDRNGVICFIEAGSITDKKQFLRLFSAFTADDYTGPVLLDGVPAAKPTAEQPAADVLQKALNITDERITVEPLADAVIWPFIPTQDAAGVQATNGGDMETAAALILNVTAEAGEALQYDYAVSCPVVLDSLTVLVDGEQAQYYGGELDWASGYVPFETAGAHTVVFTFRRGTSMIGEASARLREVKLLSAEQTAALDAQAARPPKALSGVECNIVIAEGEYKEIVITENSDQGGENKTTAVLVPEGDLTLRVQIGADVDERVAYVTDAAKGVLLANLPFDEQGFLYRAKALSMAGGNTSPYSAFMVGSSAEDRENSYNMSLMCFASEADIDEYVKSITMLAETYQVANYSMTWEYADGSSKQTMEADAASALPDGMAEYRFVVVDEAGAGVAGAMLQICDEGTCQVAVTDENGVATHVAAVYPYEIHLLKAPDGYAPYGETHVMPQEGGELIITLQKQ